MGIDRLHFVGLILACIGCASGGQTGAPSIFDGGVDFTVADGGHDLPDGALADAGPIPDGMIEPEEPFEPAPPTIYRLTQAQYRNVISDVFGPDIQVPEELEPDTPLHGFASIGAGELSISPVAVEQYEAAAQQIAQEGLKLRRHRCTSGLLCRGVPLDGRGDVIHPRAGVEVVEVVV